ncbi:glycoside hydrolase family protein 32 [Klebsiella aerogenes]|nr:glycoside hydrolase family protein 32 [Klebsiella aerogenes]
MHLRWDCARSSAEQYGLRFGDGLRIYVDAQQQRLVVERYYPQFGLCGTRSVPLTAGRISTCGYFSIALRLRFSSMMAKPA